MPENSSGEPLVRIALGLAPLPVGQREAERERLRRLERAARQFTRQYGVVVQPHLLAETMFDPDATP